MRKIVSGYENYFVYDNGDVLNITTGKKLKGSIGEHGYKYYRLSKNKSKKMFYAHRLVAEAFLPNPDNLPVVNHKDGNKLNNSVDNLEWVSYSENAQHAHDNNLINYKRNRSQFYEFDLPGEIWKQIFNFPYSVSNQGRVKNDRTQMLLKPSLSCGYLKVRPSVEGKVYDLMIHKIVYCVFNNINNIPEGYVIDHINANKQDNRLDNLRLITISENVKNALYVTKTNKNCKTVAQYSRDGEYIATFPSAREAARILKLDSSVISKVCRGDRYKTHGGFIFKYV